MKITAHKGKVFVNEQEVHSVPGGSRVDIFSSRVSGFSVKA